MGRQGHFIDDLLILMANIQGPTTNNFCWKLIRYTFNTDSSEQYNMESIRIDLKNSNIVGSGSGNTKTDGLRHVIVQCMRVLTVRVQVQVLSSQVRVQVRVHCFQVQVLKICTRVLLEYKYQVLQLWVSITQI